MLSTAPIQRSSINTLTTIDLDKHGGNVSEDHISRLDDDIKPHKSPEKISDKKFDPRSETRRTTFMRASERNNERNDSERYDTKIQNNVYNIKAKDDSSVILRYDRGKGGFMFYTYDRIPLGGFGGKEYIKYVVGHFVDGFLKDVDSLSSKEVIERYLCVVDKSESLGLDCIKFKSYQDSPFTGDIEMMFKLYKMIENFEKNRLEEELYNVSDDIKDKIREIFVCINYSFLNHILKIIAIISDVIKGSDNKKLNDKMLRFGTVAMHKLTLILERDIDRKIKMSEKYDRDIKQNEEEREIVLAKLSDLEKMVLSENLALALSKGGDLSEKSSSISEMGGINKYLSSTSDITHLIDEGVSTSTSLNKMTDLNRFDDNIDNLSYLSTQETNKNSKSKKDSVDIIDVSI